MDAVGRACQDLGHRLGLDVRFDVSGSPVALARNGEVVLLRAVQVALVNVAQHSGARDAVVRLAFAGEEVCLSVQDAGKGMGPGKVGFGLSQLAARAEEIGGGAVVLSRPEGGTTVEVRVPASAGASRSRGALGHEAQSVRPR